MSVGHENHGKVMFCCKVSSNHVKVMLFFSQVMILNLLRANIRIDTSFDFRTLVILLGWNCSMIIKGWMVVNKL